MTADAAQPLACLHVGDAAHGVERPVVFVQHIEEDALARGHAEVSRAVGLDGRGAEDRLGLEARVGPDLHGVGAGVDVALVALDDLHVLGLARGGRVEAFVDVLDDQLPVVAGLVIGQRRQLRRPWAGTQRHGEQRRELLVAIDELLATVHVEQVETIARRIGLAGGETVGEQEVVLAERVGTVVPAGVRLLVGGLDEADGRDPRQSLGLIGALSQIDDAERPGSRVVVGRADAGQLARPGNLLRRGIVERVGVLLAEVAAVDEPRVGAVGTHGPDHLNRRPELHHILPPREADPPVMEEERVPLPVLASGDLYRVRAVGLHREDTVRQRPVAALHEAAGPVGHEGDAPVGEVERVAVLARALGQPIGRGVSLK